ncbi:MAG: ABC transporter substrate-binding protein [Actinobacteria bacterium]|nr:ABC transporter substrate-binding protein [Actinomycetota bacterium]
MMRKRFGMGASIVVLALFVALSITTFGCGTKVQKPKDFYKIGAVLSTSGPAAPLGQPEQRSLALLEEKINSEGGIDGVKVKFIIEDDESDPAKATVAINKLIKQENVVAVIGSSTTGATLAMVPVTSKEMVTLICCAAGTKITDPVNEWVFRTPPTDSMAIAKVISYLEDVLEVSKIAILHDANAFGTGGADELQAKAPDHDIEVVAREQYGSTDTDMTAQLTKIQQTPAQAVVVWGTNPGPASIAKNMQQLGMTIPYIGSHGIANKKFIELGGSAADGVAFPAGKLLFPSSIATGSDWRNAVDEFSAAYKEKYEMDIDTFAAHGWDAGLIITDALKRSGNDPIKLRDEIEKTKDFVAVDGIYTYSPTDHDGLNVDDLLMIKIANGAWTEVK